MSYLDTTAGAAREGGVSTAALDAGVLSADATGRALMATGLFNAATVADKFGTDSFTNAVILQLIQDGAFAAAASSRALFADRFMPQAKLALRDVEAHTTDDTLTVAESGSVHTSVGAGGAVVLTLPAAVVGLEYFFYVGAAQELRIDPNASETISLPSDGVPGAGGAYLTANAIGESVHLLCAVAGSWSVMGFTGTWTAV